MQLKHFVVEKDLFAFPVPTSIEHLGSRRGLSYTSSTDSRAETRVQGSMGFGMGVEHSWRKDCLLPEQESEVEVGRRSDQRSSGCAGGI